MDENLGRAKQFKNIYDKTSKEIEKTKWWDFKRLKHLRTRLRWAGFHYKKNLKTYYKETLNG